MQPHLPTHRRPKAPRRGGAVIIVVLALLSLMIFLGVFFFEFAQEEQLAAQNYANNQFAEIVNPEVAFTESDVQLIFGADANHTMSPLYSGDGFTYSAPSGMPVYGPVGSHTSLLAHVIGRVLVNAASSPLSTPTATPTDLLPHNGPGITTTYVDVNSNGYCDPSDYVRFDMDGDGNPDAVLDPTTDPLATGPSGLPGFGINFSRAAQQDYTTDAFKQPGTGAYGALRPFRPDVDYTYPDINNIFLAYEAVVGSRRIFIPSFHRPDLLMSYRQSGFDNVFTDVQTRRLVMRPHAEHRYSDGTRRFIIQGTQALSGDRGRVIGPFPFQTDIDQDGKYNEQGYYSLDSSTGLNENYELDVDVNGDGEPDGIWMDIGLDIITLSDGRQYVPLVSYLVLDADSLINLNVHGNLDGLRINGASYTSGPFSVSNTGASPSEVNPLRVLPGDPASIQNRTDLALAQYQAAWNFGFAPNTVQTTSATSLPANSSLLPMANMEWYFLTAGREKARRITQSGGSPIWARATALEGRYGDFSLINQSTIGVVGSIPAPGSQNTDDDLDNNPNSQQRYSGGQHVSTYTLRDPRGSSTTAVHIPYGSHPVAPRGTGRDVHLPITDPSFGQRRLVAGAAGSPVVWPEYPSGWEAPNAAASPALKVVEHGYPYGGTVFPTGYNSMIDEEDETDITGSSTDDNKFDVSENLRLHAATADYARLNETSRLDELAPFNMISARSAEKNRRNFTTHTFDLSELTYIPRVFYDSSSSTTFRPEVSVWSASGLSGRYAFPPDYGVSSSPSMLTDLDPMRPELRMLLASEDSNYSTGARRETTTANFLNSLGNTNVRIWRQPLNLNRLLVGFDTNGNPIFRHLTPHPDMVAASVSGTVTIPPMIHAHSSAVPFQLSSITGAGDASDVTILEWWARYDRQRLARDIYTLLYLVGAAQDIDTATGGYQTPLTTQYPPEVTREMAQFAVNYVDALDRDDVITKFEYDDDLRDGWNDPPGKYVYGVERASLTFSEVEMVQVDTDSDHTHTLHKEENANRHQYLHIELRNVSPFTVDLDKSWRLSRVARGSGTRDKSVQFQRNGSNTAKQIIPGANFLIATHDGSVQNGSGNPICSDLYADYTGGSELESILPSSNQTVPDSTATPDPQADLDLCTSLPASNPHSDYFTITAGDAGTTYTGTKLVEEPTAIGPVLFDLVLERRQNPYGITDPADTTDARGDWIEVDRIIVDSSRMGLNNGRLKLNSDDQPGVVTAFEGLNSVERRQAFDPIQISHTSGAGSGVVVNHTMAKLTSGSPQTTSSAANSALTTTQFTLWQPHFDRDLTSKYELLSIPLFGNWPLNETRTSITNTGGAAINTFYKEIQGGSQFNLAPGGTVAASGHLSGDFTAGIRFKFPNGIPGKPYQGWNAYSYQNCWYRLLDFVTVPRRADQRNENLVDTSTGGAEPSFRIPGKINLNTIRDDMILAALIDDEVHLSYGQKTIDNITQYRDWYRELLQSRDGTDYFAATAGLHGLPLPNSLISHPFRGSSDIRNNNWSTTLYDDGIENGLLRSAPRRDQANLTSNTPLGLRKAGAPYTSPTLTAPIDFSAGLWAGSPPYDTTDLTKTNPSWQGLFDAGDRDSQLLDHHTRDRILAKVANNSTSKSHVYLVWTAVGYFEAHQVPAASLPGGVATQIGARMTDLPIHRKFMVVDMSQIDSAYNSATSTFDDHRSFILYEKRLR